MTRNGGYLKLHRQITENELWFSERFTKAQAWIDLLLLATYKPRTLFIRGIEIHLQPGELCYSQLSLAKRWKWSDKTVKRFLKSLECRDMLRTKICNVTTVISITKWREYQINSEQTTEQNPNNFRTNKNVKNVKEDCEPDGSQRGQPKNLSKSVSPVVEFETWWKSEYRGRFGAHYIVNHGKDRKHIKVMLGACGGDVGRLRAVASAFFEQSDDFLKRAGHTIGVFYTRFNALNKEATNGAAKSAGPTRFQTFSPEKTTYEPRTA